MTLRRVHRGLCLTHGGLVGLVVDDKEHLSGTHRLAFLDINLSEESLQLRTDLNVLNTIDDGRIGALHGGGTHFHSRHRVLIVAKLRTPTATTAAHKECAGSDYHKNLFLFHTYFIITKLILLIPHTYIIGCKITKIPHYSNRPQNIFNKVYGLLFDVRIKDA